jgi:hypothetical protein
MTSSRTSLGYISEIIIPTTVIPPFLLLLVPLAAFVPPPHKPQDLPSFLSVVRGSGKY